MRITQRNDEARRHSRRNTLACLAVGFAALVANRGVAQADDVLRPGTRPWFLGFGVGPTLFLGSDRGTTSDPFTRGNLQVELGYHFFGDSSGPALGPSFELGFGRDTTSVEPGLKLWWDIPLGDVSIYLTPALRLGYGGVFFDGLVAHAFTLQLGLELKFLFDDRGFFGIRPITADLWAGNVGFGGPDRAGNVGVFWNLLIEGGFTF